MRPPHLSSAIGSLLAHAFGSTVSDHLAANHLRPASRSTVDSDKRTDDRRSASFTKSGPGRKHKAGEPYARHGGMGHINLRP